MTMKLDLPNFAQEIKALAVEGRDYPPVEDWHPERSGDVDIRIDANGRWLFQGEVMEREAIVRLFASILRKDDDGYWLVTPGEKMKIQVEDVPFVVRLMNVEGEGRDRQIYLSTNVGDHFRIDEQHPLVVGEGDTEEKIPYVLARSRLQARLARTVYYELAELVEAHPQSGQLGVWSGGAFFGLS